MVAVAAAEVDGEDWGGDDEGVDAQADLGGEGEEGGFCLGGL